MYTSNVAAVRSVIIISRRPQETNEVMKPIHTHVLVPDVQPYNILLEYGFDDPTTSNKNRP